MNLSKAGVDPLNKNSSDSKNIRVTFSYKGTNFHGLVEQPNNDAGVVRSVIGELRSCIELVTQQSVHFTVAGRTDKGVHAREQVASFKVEGEHDLEKMARTCNKRLAPEIIVTSIEEVDENFHARFSAKARKYRYFIYNNDLPHLMLDDFSWHVRYDLDIEAMQKAAQHFVGEKDFTSVCKASDDVEHNIREVFQAEFIDGSIDLISFDNVDSNMLCFEISANAFCWQMVRSIVGVLVQVGRGKIDADDIPALLDKKDREYGGELSPAKGLVLWEVSY